MSSRPDLTVIVVSWNVRDFVLEALAAVERTRGDLDLQVVLVDNDSMDGTVEAVAEAYPAVEIVASEINLGFPLGNNLGLRRARGRHVLFLNPDAEVGEGTLAAMIEELDADPSVGMVGPRLVYGDGRLQPECGRRHYRLPHLIAEGLYLHVLFPDSGWANHQRMGGWDHRDRRDVEAISGACMAVRGELIHELGGLPTDLFMYHEDLALCLRVGDAGYRVRCLGDVVTVHHGGESSSRSSSPLLLFEGEVRVRLIRERGGPLAWLARPFMAIRQSTRCAIALALRLPGLGGVRRRWPRVADLRKHARILLWTVAPARVLARLPSAPDIDLDEVPLREVSP